jgi:hypothetical protein
MIDTSAGILFIFAALGTFCAICLLGTFIEYDRRRGRSWRDRGKR